MLEDKAMPLETGSLQVGGLVSGVRGSAFPIVGAGASAGGLEALTQLLTALPANTGMGFVIVQHLAPTRQSDLTKILSRATKMPVCEVGEDCGELKVEPNHVYVIPPGQDMIIKGRKLKLLPQERHPLHRGIDQFFQSLAEDCGHLAIGVVLSGNASDGTLGLEAIKGAGGITFAQDKSAQHESMPRSAEASGCVDFVLSPEGIAREITHISQHTHVAPETPGGATEGLTHARITQIVQRATGVDFTHYKLNTLHRRITRRMLLHNVETLPDYEEYLKDTPKEAQALFQDILINVTSFFRDPETFEVLAREIFPKLLKGRSRTEPVRIWTLACSTGEEAYSLAMIYAEAAEAAGSLAPLQIFATDLNSVSIGKARTGLYSRSITQTVSPERLCRFFTEETAGYRVIKSLREQCVFSRHDVLTDPPFSQVDLVSCRNMLIYMEPVLQLKIMPLLHYALKPGGYLLLGGSETAGTSRTLFEIENARHKIYSRRPGASPLRSHIRAQASAVGSSPFPLIMTNSRELPPEGLPKEAERILLTKYVPPGVVISEGLDIVQFRGETGAYLAPAAGVPSLNLLKMLREGLLFGVRAAILRATETGGPTREEGLRVKGENGFHDLAVDVIPIKSGAAKDRGFLILFDEGGAAPVMAAPAAAPGEEDELSRLTKELAATREYLHSIIDQQEIVNGELQSANEEAQSANEELQSVNEEMETSREEAQSSNEELATVNEELNNRNFELNRLNEALRLAGEYAESIVASVRSPLVVLDAALRVKTASAAFYETFLVTPAKTEGRLIYDLGNGQWNIPALRRLLEELLPQEERIHDFEVRHTFEQIGPRIMILNARRLKAAVDSQPLIVLAFEDVTGRRALEDSLMARAADLVRADRSKDEFLAMLAHELRNPLAPMRNAAEIMRTPGVTEEACEQSHQIFSRQIDNMSRMIDDLLDVSRITEGKIGLRKQVVRLDAIFTAAESLARPGIELRAQTFAVTLPEEPIFLNADATRLEQIFGNLLGNARKYSDPGCHITLSAERAPVTEHDEPEVIVRVRDNGMGIAAELLPRIFDLFVQSTRALDRAHGGLGIGLTLVQRLVKLHGGSVAAHSGGAGLGSEFTVRLPILPSPVAVAVTPAPVMVRETPRRMLIVDDNEDSARSMAMLQRLRGHDTRVAFTGPAAVTAAEEFAPEVVLLDIGLPGMNGFEVVRCLRAMPALANAFLVGMSGYGSDEDRVLAREAGFDEYLVKPVDTKLLRSWLQNGIERVR
ncbi:MAG: CheR family methyltransferase [Prosthecobacter sp.]|nr:CheR family methyltransferase [Prosthecobacter sp.]